MLKILILSLFLCACSSNDNTTIESRHPDAKVFHDAPPPPADAALGTSSGVVSCYLSGNPAQACILSHNFCCFDNYSASHNGSCTTSCVTSDEHCDGQEDCPTGQRCYANVWSDALDMLHWTLACHVTPVSSSDLIMCHPGDGTCPAGTACTQANPTAGIFDFPTTLYVCH